MVNFLDTRNGTGKSKTVEIQYDNLRSAGRTPDGFERFEYFDSVPFIYTKTTYSEIGDESYWVGLIDSLESYYNGLTSIPTGTFTESVSVGGGFFLIDGKEFFAGTWVEVDYGNNTPTSPPQEFKIVESPSANVSPQSYLPGSNEAIYSGSAVASSLSRSSTLTKNLADSTRLLDPHPTDSEYILTSHSYSNPRYIGSTIYVDANRTYSRKIADISLI